MSNVNRNMKRALTEVRALPDEVAIEINKVEGWDGYFTPKEARKFAAQILAAAAEAPMLDWSEEDENGDIKIVPATAKA